MACCIVGSLMRTLGALLVTATCLVYGVILIKDREESLKSNLELMTSNLRLLGLESEMTQLKRALPLVIKENAEYIQAGIGAVLVLGTIGRPFLGPISRLFCFLGGLCFIGHIALCESSYLVSLAYGATSPEMIAVSLSVSLSGSLFIFASGSCCQSKCQKEKTQSEESRGSQRPNNEGKQKKPQEHEEPKGQGKKKKGSHK